MSQFSSKFAADRAGALSGRLFDDVTRAINTPFERPRLTGAAAPSERFVARAMARAVDLRGEGAR